MDKPIRPEKEELKEKLSPMAYAVTQENATERPFSGKYDDFYEKGIYVDIVSGEPLFSSAEKYDAGCGWPSFSKPITKRQVREKADFSWHASNRSSKQRSRFSSRTCVYRWTSRSRWSTLLHQFCLTEIHSI